MLPKQGKNRPSISLLKKKVNFLETQKRKKIQLKISTAKEKMVKFFTFLDGGTDVY